MKVRYFWPAMALVAALGQTQAQDCCEWIEHVTEDGPPVRYDHAMAYDSARDVVVLFGGYDIDNDIYYDDTWEWDGVDRTWTLVTPVTTIPPPRFQHAMAYDADRGVVVMFGGNAGPRLGDIN